MAKAIASTQPSHHLHRPRSIAPPSQNRRAVHPCSAHSSVTQHRTDRKTALEIRSRRAGGDGHPKWAESLVIDTRLRSQQDIRSSPIRYVSGEAIAVVRTPEYGRNCRCMRPPERIRDASCEIRPQHLVCVSLLKSNLCTKSSKCFTSCSTCSNLLEHLAGRTTRGCGGSKARSSRPPKSCLRWIGDGGN